MKILFTILFVLVSGSVAFAHNEHACVPGYAGETITIDGSFYVVPTLTVYAVNTELRCFVQDGQLVCDDVKAAVSEPKDEESTDGNVHVLQQPDSR